MTEQEQQSGSSFQGSLAGAREPAAERRSDLPDSPDLNGDAPNSDLHDISKILLGAQAISGKAMTSAGRMTVGAEARHALRDQQTREDRQARELASLARWNTQMTTVGGVQMTNEQAQKARQRFINHEDDYAERAVRAGYVKPEEKEELKRGMRRKLELEDKTGRGTLTDSERKELREWDQSRLGQAGDKITAEMHQGNGIAANATFQRDAQRADASSITNSERGTSFARSEDVFQSAPKFKTDFAEAVAAKSPEPVSETSAPAPLSRKVSASGLDA